MTLPLRPDGKANWGLSNLMNTTLPTRADGGIDYNFLAEKMGYSNGDEVLAFMRLAAAHTRERCAKWHDDEVKARSLSLDEEAVHKESAAALRKMED